jgi:ribosomal protein S18 acetylase RimI-like enzyme
MEKIDEEILSKPEEYILSKGGMIWFAKHPTLGIIGTCALLNSGNNEYELTKMGVFSKARGPKVGEILLQYVLDYVQTEKITLCYLLTNSKCEAAIHLYLKNNFSHNKVIMDRFGYRYERCNVAMKWSSQEND